MIAPFLIFAFLSLLVVLAADAWDSYADEGKEDWERLEYERELELEAEGRFGCRTLSSDATGSDRRTA